MQQSPAITPTTTWTTLDESFSQNPLSRQLLLLTNEKSVIQSVKNLLSTNHYERPFHSEIGCNINSLLFQPFTPLTASMIQREIEDCLTNFEPRVNIINVEVTPQPSQYGFSASITFSILNRPNTITLRMILSRGR